MADQFPFFAAETGTYLTTSPNPHVDLSATAASLGPYPARTFAVAASDSDTDFVDESTCTVLILKDSDNWARYAGVVWNDEATDNLDLSGATLESSAGTLSTSDAITVFAGHPTSAFGTTTTVTTTSHTAASETIILVDDDTAAAEVTVTLPAVASSGGKRYEVKKLGSTANVVVDGNASETIDGTVTQTISLQYDSLGLVCDGTEWWII